MRPASPNTFNAGSARDARAGRDDNITTFPAEATFATLHVSSGGGGRRHFAGLWLGDQHRRDASTQAWLDLRVREAHLAALLEGHDLLERFGEIELEIVPFGPAQMRRAQHVGHGEQWMVPRGDRLLLIDVDRRITPPSIAQGGGQ